MVVDVASIKLGVISEAAAEAEGKRRLVVQFGGLAVLGHSVHWARLHNDLPHTVSIVFPEDSELLAGKGNQAGARGNFTFPVQHTTLTDHARVAEQFDRDSTSYPPIAKVPCNHIALREALQVSTEVLPQYLVKGASMIKLVKWRPKFSRFVPVCWKLLI